MNLEKAGLFVLIAILVGGLASSPVFVSINAAYAQTDDVDVSESDEMEEPTACTMEYAPVCGKDGETYGNMCMLEASDAEFAYDGECETDYEDNDYDKDSVRYHDKRCWETDDGELRCEGHAGKCVRTDDGIRCEAHDRRCWETDSGELRCEGHDGKCMKTDDGIRCEYEHNYKRDIKMMLDKYCDMTDEEQDRFLAEHDYFREHHDRLANYCEMSEDERDDYRETHHDMMMDFKERHHDMVGEMKDKHHDIRMQKMMERDYKITDERKDELKMKFREKYSDLSDEQRDEIRFEIEAKYDKHFKMKFKARHDSLSDQARADLLQRHSEMRDYKAELRERHDAMTDEERDQFRMDFYSKAKDMRHAWLSPHKQMMAGISVDEIECREGLNLVMKNSNGKVMCMKSSTAERLIEKGIVVPA